MLIFVLTGVAGCPHTLSAPSVRVRLLNSNWRVQVRHFSWNVWGRKSKAPQSDMPSAMSHSFLRRFALMKNVTRSNGEVDDPCIYKVVTHVAFEACLVSST